MALTTEERIEVILMSGERSFRVIAADFNNRHPERPPISHNTVRCGNFQIPRDWDCGRQGTEWPSKKCYWRDNLKNGFGVLREEPTTQHTTFVSRMWNQPVIDRTNPSCSSMASIQDSATPAPTRGWLRQAYAVFHLGPRVRATRSLF